MLIFYDLIFTYTQQVVVYLFDFTAHVLCAVLKSQVFKSTVGSCFAVSYRSHMHMELKS